MQIAAERGRATRPNLKLGICGEHGGDPASIKFCETVGLDYVSCSPYRVPIARLAAAQAALLAKAGNRSNGGPSMSVLINIDVPDLDAATEFYTAASAYMWAGGSARMPSNCWAPSPSICCARRPGRSARRSAANL